VSEDLGLSQEDDETETGHISVFSWTRSNGSAASTDKTRNKAFILDIRGQPYTAVGEYAARWVHMSGTVSLPRSMPCLNLLKAGVDDLCLRNRRVQTAFREYRASRPQVARRERNSLVVAALSPVLSVE